MEKSKRKPPERISEVTFHYTLAPHFRNLYANGVWGGPNPHGEIVMNFFLERTDLPQQVKYKITEKKGLEEVSRIPKQDKRIRETQVAVVLNLNVARSVKDWLEEKIALIDSAMAKAEDEAKGGDEPQ